MSQLLAELHKSIDIVQREMEITKEDTNKIIFAEIASRWLPISLSEVNILSL